MMMLSSFQYDLIIIQTASCFFFGGGGLDKGIHDFVDNNLIIAHYIKYLLSILHHNSF